MDKFTNNEKYLRKVESTAKDIVNKALEGSGLNLIPVDYNKLYDEGDVVIIDDNPPKGIYKSLINQEESFRYVDNGWTKYDLTVELDKVKLIVLNTDYINFDDGGSNPDLARIISDLIESRPEIVVLEVDEYTDYYSTLLGINLNEGDNVLLVDPYDGPYGYPIIYSVLYELYDSNSIDYLYNDIQYSDNNYDGYYSYSKLGLIFEEDYQNFVDNWFYVGDSEIYIYNIVIIFPDNNWDYEGTINYSYANNKNAFNPEEYDSFPYINTWERLLNTDSLESYNRSKLYQPNHICNLSSPEGEFIVKSLIEDNYILPDGEYSIGGIHNKSKLVSSSKVKGFLDLSEDEILPSYNPGDFLDQFNPSEMLSDPSHNLMYDYNSNYMIMLIDLTYMKISGGRSGGVIIGDGPGTGGGSGGVIIGDGPSTPTLEVTEPLWIMLVNKGNSNNYRQVYNILENFDDFDKYLISESLYDGNYTFPTLYSNYTNSEYELDFKMSGIASVSNHGLPFFNKDNVEEWRSLFNPLGPSIGVSIKYPNFEWILVGDGNDISQSNGSSDGGSTSGSSISEYVEGDDYPNGDYEIGDIVTYSENNNSGIFIKVSDNPGGKPSFDHSLGIKSNSLNYLDPKKFRLLIRFGSNYGTDRTFFGLYTRYIQFDESSPDLNNGDYFILVKVTNYAMSDGFAYSIVKYIGDGVVDGVDNPGSITADLSNNPQDYELYAVIEMGTPFGYDDPINTHYRVERNFDFGGGIYIKYSGVAVLNLSEAEVSEFPPIGQMGLPGTLKGGILYNYKFGELVPYEVLGLNPTWRLLGVTSGDTSIKDYTNSIYTRNDLVINSGKLMRSLVYNNNSYPNLDYSINGSEFDLEFLELPSDPYVVAGGNLTYLQLFLESDLVAWKFSTYETQVIGSKIKSAPEGTAFVIANCYDNYGDYYLYDINICVHTGSGDPLPEGYDHDLSTLMNHISNNREDYLIYNVKQLGFDFTGYIEIPFNGYSFNPDFYATYIPQSDKIVYKPVDGYNQNDIDKFNYDWEVISGSESTQNEVFNPQEYNLIDFVDGIEASEEITVQPAPGEVNCYSLDTDGNGTWIGLLYSGTNRIMKSIDDGKIWNSYPAPENNEWRTLVTDKKGTWIGLSKSGTNRIIRSVDNGETWEVKPSPENNSWYGLATDENGTWIGVSLDGTNRVMRSTDNGETWSPINVTNSSWRSIATDKKGTWVATAISSSHRVMRSTDNGETWTSQVTPENNSWYGLDTDENGIWIASSYDGTNRMMKSVDNGETWNTLSLPKSDYWYSIATNNNGTWMSISSDYILKSEDNGVTWSDQVSPVSSPLQILITNNKGIWIGLTGGAFSYIFRLEITPEQKFENIVSEYRLNGQKIEPKNKILDIVLPEFITDSIDYVDSPVFELEFIPSKIISVFVDKDPVFEDEYTLTDNELDLTGYAFSGGEKVRVTYVIGSEPEGGALPN